MHLFSRFLSSILVAFFITSAPADPTFVSSVPQGYLTFSLPATSPSANWTGYFSLPLSSDTSYQGIVATVTANSITTMETPAPFTGTMATLATATTPYFVKFLSGKQAGRSLLITANTTSALTLDTTDHSAQTVALTAGGFNVSAGDSFEVFAGDTLASVFGDNTTQQPLILKGGTAAVADTVGIYSTALVRWQLYFFDTAAGCWKLTGTTTNASNTILYPGATFSITRHANQVATSFIVTGRVADIARQVKTAGSGAVIYDSTGLPVDVPLSQLQLGPNWTMSTIPAQADTVAVWNTALLRWDTYFQLPDSKWRLLDNSPADQSALVLTAGSSVVLRKRAAVSGAGSYLRFVLPYTLN